MFYQRLAHILQLSDPAQKCQQTQQLYADWQQQPAILDAYDLPLPIGEAGRPDKPELVPPREVPSRGMGSELGRIILAHAIAHIEFNAINLALDAAYRFRNMPADYYGDWLKVAAEEAYHFSLLRDYLQQRGHDYGDFPAHQSLWEMAQRTAHDVMVRMALVPRVMEARGLDVTPGIIKKLQQVKDQALVAHLEIIHRDEIGHVAIGSKWFRYVCNQRQMDARVTFRQLVDDYMKGSLKGPFDEVVRTQAGFSEEELADLRAMEL
ncbi:MAG: ferritin-like domain-containing protein [Gammaproteobacteria bacterium]|jgi:uncharacterized ferritin-like protein (DUF455 family)|nr:ferritin-like domain-containing protein [Gammaproteobacteria bacterium]